MSGIGGLGPTSSYRPLQRADKDGGGAGGGGTYLPNDQRKRDEQNDEAEISEEAKEKLARIKMQQAAEGDPSSSSAQLHILNEIKHFNDLHTRSGSPLKAVLKPGDDGQVLHIEDPRESVDLQPFGERDVFHFSPQEVRTKLETFDHSSGTNFDFRA